MPTRVIDLTLTAYHGMRGVEIHPNTSLDKDGFNTTQLKLYSHAMGSSPLGWYAPKEWLAQARKDFPRCLAEVPVLLPSAHASVRMRIDQWFEQQGVLPNVVGEFEDSALLATFGSSGMGVFPASERMREKLSSGYGLEWFAPCEGVQEHFYAIGTARKVQHPLVQKLLAAVVP